MSCGSKSVFPAAGGGKRVAGERAFGRVGGADADAEADGQPAGRRREEQLVVLSAGQRLVEGGAGGDGDLVEGEADTGLVGDVSEVGDQTIGNVDHRRRAGA